ncbi:MAG: type II toxin-antitoxin system VapC family toxin [Planctomycetota bacterium]
MSSRRTTRPRRRYLLDTHALLWWLSNPARLSVEARAVIASAENTILVSAAAAWEMSLERALGRLDFPDDLAETLAAESIEIVPIELEHALGAGDLPAHHGDPFDRLQIAQALLENLVVVTRDEQFAAYGVEVLRA